MKVDIVLEENRLLEELYDIIRIVDPVTKIVYDTKFINGYDKKLKKLDDMKYCFDFWGDDKPCENCISSRVMNEKKVYMKTEYNGKDVYIVTSIYIEYNGGKYILEVISEITKKELLNELKGKNYFEIKRILMEKNIQMVTDELTGTYNRRFINERLPFEMIFHETYKENIVIAMADIDFFKNVND
ncbi:MAG: diguanylate cyclase, partial [Clostridiales bacterium]|nr:diguanylate cyclase [Clostridiales bacterium]